MSKSKTQNFRSYYKTVQFIILICHPCDCHLKHHCYDIQRSCVRPYVPMMFRRAIFSQLHSLSYPGMKASRKMIHQRFVRPGMLKDFANWTRSCLECQKSKIHQHASSPLQKFNLPSCRFSHGHLDLFGTLSFSYIPLSPM